MPTARLALVALALALPLGACKDNANKQASASGQILPGSASDAMLPEDRLTSQPPLDPTAQRAGQTAAGPEATATAPAEAAPEAAAPAATAAAQ